MTVPFNIVHKYIIELGYANLYVGLLLEYFKKQFFLLTAQ